MAPSERTGMCLRGSVEWGVWLVSQAVHMPHRGGVGLCLVDWPLQRYTLYIPLAPGAMLIPHLTFFGFVGSVFSWCGPLWVGERWCQCFLAFGYVEGKEELGSPCVVHSTSAQTDFIWGKCLPASYLWQFLSCLSWSHLELSAGSVSECVCVCLKDQIMIGRACLCHLLGSFQG